MTDTAPKLFDGYTVTREAFVRGGSGVVHEAVDPRGRRVAIKVLDRNALEQKLSAAIGEETRDPNVISRKTSLAYEQNVERFKEEYRALTSLNHPNIAKVYEMGFREGSFYIVSEYVEGKPIAEHVFVWKPTDMIELFIDALKGLDYIHRNGLLHLDIKSENILVQMVDGKPLVKIIDFGLSMAPAEYKGGFLGSVNYMAPEIVLGLKDQVDARSDLFSFGVLMYYCITWGSHPFARPIKADRELMRRVIEHDALLKHDPPSYAHKSRPGYVPDFLDKIIMRLVAHDPKDRFYGNARAVINALATHKPDAFAESLETKGSYLRPVGDKHIGNEAEQTKVFAALDALVSGGAPSPAIIAITGEQGTGKSHLLKKIKEHAERHADKLAIKKIELPADETTFKRFSDDIALWASENKMPAVVLIDGMGTFPSPLRGEGRGEGDLSNTLTGLFQTITSRESNPALYSGQQPLFIAFTGLSSISLSFLRKQESREVPHGIPASAGMTIHLSPFTLAELKDYLSSTPAFAGKKVPDEFVSRLHAATKGIQAEVDAHLRERDSDSMLFNLDGEIVVGDFKRHERPSATTEARLKKTYEDLLPEERRILDFLSVWGLKGITPPPDPETISHLVPSTLLTLHLNALVQTSVIASEPRQGRGDEAIQSNNTAYTFTNNYFSTLIYNQLDEKTKTRLHDSIARHLSSVIASESRQRRDDEAISSAIFLHQGFGSDKTLAIKSLVRLTKATLYNKGRADLAEALLKHALSIVNGSLKLKLYLSGLFAEALFYEGKITEAINILNFLECKHRALQISLNLKLAVMLIKQRQYDASDAVIERTMALFEDAHKKSLLYITLLNCKAIKLYHQSKGAAGAKDMLLEALGIFEESAKLEKKIPRCNAERINTNLIGLVLRNIEKISDAKKSLERNLTKKEHTVFSKISALVALAETYRLSSKHQKALKFGKEALALAKATGQVEGLLSAHSLLANIYHDMNRFDEAIAENNNLLAVSSCVERGKKLRNTTAMLWVQLGHCYKEKKDWDNALLHFEAAVGANAEGQHLMSAHLGIGEVFFNTGKNEKALVHLSKAAGVLKDMPKNIVTASHGKRIKEILDLIATPPAAGEELS